MSFGLVNASASFNRLMRKLLDGMQSIDNFIDDVIIYTKSFQEHMQIVREFLERLRVANLTAKPSKCFIGFQSLECLGHIAGDKHDLPPRNRSGRFWDWLDFIGNSYRIFQPLQRQ